eukprot:1150582-Prorocentrum_minimum.AAC.1
MVNSTVSVSSPISYNPLQGSTQTYGVRKELVGELNSRVLTRWFDKDFMVNFREKLRRTRVTLQNPVWPLGSTRTVGCNPAEGHHWDASFAECNYLRDSSFPSSLSWGI